MSTTDRAMETYSGLLQPLINELETGTASQATRDMAVARLMESMDYAMRTLNTVSHVVNKMEPRVLNIEIQNTKTNERLAASEEAIADTKEDILELQDKQTTEYHSKSCPWKPRVDEIDTDRKTIKKMFTYGIGVFAAVFTIFGASMWEHINYLMNISEEGMRKDMVDIATSVYAGTKQVSTSPDKKTK